MQEVSVNSVEQEELLLVVNPDLAAVQVACAVLARPGQEISRIAHVGLSGRAVVRLTVAARYHGLAAHVSRGGAGEPSVVLTAARRTAPPASVPTAPSSS